MLRKLLLILAWGIIALCGVGWVLSYRQGGRAQFSHVDHHADYYEALVGVTQWGAGGVEIELSHKLNVGRVIGGWGLDDGYSADFYMTENAPVAYPRKIAYGPESNSIEFSGIILDHAFHYAPEAFLEEGEKDVQSRYRIVTPFWAPMLLGGLVLVWHWGRRRREAKGFEVVGKEGKP